MKSLRKIKEISTHLIITVFGIMLIISGICLVNLPDAQAQGFVRPAPMLKAEKVVLAGRMEKSRAWGNTQKHAEIRRNTQAKTPSKNTRSYKNLNGKVASVGKSAEIRRNAQAKTPSKNTRSYKKRYIQKNKMTGELNSPNR